MAIMPVASALDSAARACWCLAHAPVCFRPDFAILRDIAAERFNFLEVDDGRMIRTKLANLEV
jgi:hypothetical protein